MCQDSFQTYLNSHQTPKKDMNAKGEMCIIGCVIWSKDLVTQLFLIREVFFHKDDDPLVIIVLGGSCEIRRMLINNRSSFDLMYLITHQKLLTLVGFNESMKMLVGNIRLLVSVPQAIILINHVHSIIV